MADEPLPTPRHDAPTEAPAVPDAGAPATRRGARPPWLLPTTSVVIVAALVGGAVVAFRSLVDAPAMVIERASDAVATVAAAFKRGTISTSFVSYSTTVTNTLFLQVATLRQKEIFTRTEQMSTAFGYLPLPEVVVEARATVAYTYYLDLNGAWRFELEDSRLTVFAPPILFNEPAVDASDITYEVRKGYFKGDEATEQLKRSLSSLVRVRAKDNVALVRGNARQQTVEFVERWLERAYSDGTKHTVKVYFADEAPPPGPRAAPPLTPPGER